MFMVIKCTIFVSGTTRTSFFYKKYYGRESKFLRSTFRNSRTGHYLLYSPSLAQITIFYSIFRIAPIFSQLTHWAMSFSSLLFSRWPHVMSFSVRFQNSYGGQILRGDVYVNRNDRQQYRKATRPLSSPDKQHVSQLDYYTPWPKNVSLIR